MIKKIYSLYFNIIDFIYTFFDRKKSVNKKYDKDCAINYQKLKKFIGLNHIYSKKTGKKVSIETHYLFKLEKDFITIFINEDNKRYYVASYFNHTVDYIMNNYMTITEHRLYIIDNNI